MASYGSVDGVAAIVQNLTPSASSHPTSDEITAWLEQGCAVINRYIATAGYSVPVGSGAALHHELVALNNLYAAAYTKRSQEVDAQTGEEEKRSEIWLREFHAQLSELAASNLAAMGATPLPSTTPGRRRRIRTLQLRRVDGYSGAYEGAAAGYDYTSE